MPDRNLEAWEEQSPFLLREAGEAEGVADRAHVTSQTDFLAPLHEAYDSHEMGTPEAFEGESWLADSAGIAGSIAGRSGYSLEPSHLTAEEISVLFWRMPATAALSWLLASPELLQTTVAALLAEPARRRSIRIRGTDIAVPRYLRFLGRLFHEAAEQSEAEAGEAPAGSIYAAPELREEASLGYQPHLMGEGETPHARRSQSDKVLATYADWTDSSDRRKVRNPRDQIVQGRPLTSGAAENPGPRPGQRALPFERRLLLANFKIDGASLRRSTEPLSRRPRGGWPLRSDGYGRSLSKPTLRALEAPRHNDLLSEDRYLNTRVFLQGASWRLASIPRT